MYKVYIIKKRRGGSEVLKNTKTDTPIAAVAEAAFWALYGSDEYKNQHLLLLMTLNNKQLNAHWFDAKPGDDDYIALNSKLRLEHE